jgi:hypothetical protein
MNAKTDSYAFGVIIIELLTGLHPQFVRELIDDSMPDELEEVLLMQHGFALSGARTAGGGGGGKVKGGSFSRRPRTKCAAFPARPLAETIHIAAQCTISQSRKRLAVAPTVNQLGDILAEWDAAVPPDSGAGVQSDEM